MRLVDADAFCAFLRELNTRQHYETLLTHKDKYPTVADVIEAVCCDLDGTGLNGFDNAPTVEQEEEDMEKDENTYCHGIVNCKYYEDGECVFMDMGSGNPDDMPCLQLERETIEAFHKWREEKENNDRPQGECENCKHFKESLCENSPDGWCLIRRATQEGNLETQVPKDYYCSWYEKGGAE